MGGRHWLRIGDVQTGGSDTARPQRDNERLGVNYRPACHIDQDGSGRQELKLMPANQSVSLLGQRQCNHKHVSIGQDIMELRGGYSHVGIGKACLTTSNNRDVTSGRMKQSRENDRNPPSAENGHALARKCFRLAPVPLTLPGMLDNMTQAGEDQHQRVLSDLNAKSSLGRCEDHRSRKRIGPECIHSSG